MQGPGCETTAAWLLGTGGTGTRKALRGRRSPGFTLSFSAGVCAVKLVPGPGRSPEAPPSLRKSIIHQRPCCVISEAGRAPPSGPPQSCLPACKYPSLIILHWRFSFILFENFFFFGFCLKLIPQHWVTFPHKVGVNQVEFIKNFTIKWAHSRRRNVILLSHLRAWIILAPNSLSTPNDFRRGRQWL